MVASYLFDHSLCVVELQKALTECYSNRFQREDHSEKTPVLLNDEQPNNLPDELSIPYVALPPSIDEILTPPYDYPHNNTSTNNECQTFEAVSWLNMDEHTPDAFSISDEYGFLSDENLLGLYATPSELWESPETCYDAQDLECELQPMDDGEIMFQTGDGQLLSPALTPKYLLPSTAGASSASGKCDSEITREPAWGIAKKEENIYSDKKTAPEPKKSSNRCATRRNKSKRSSRIADKESVATTSTKSSEKASSGGRFTHNMIERQYRTRLNGHFETLFQSLPPTMKVDDTEAEQGNPGKKISKGEVLMKAREYIQDLEKEGEYLRQDNERLRARKEELESNQITIGGIAMP